MSDLALTARSARKCSRLRLPQLRILAVSGAPHTSSEQALPLPFGTVQLAGLEEVGRVMFSRVDVRKHTQTL